MYTTSRFFSRQLLNSISCFSLLWYILKNFYQALSLTLISQSYSSWSSSPVSCFAINVGYPLQLLGTCPVDVLFAIPLQYANLFPNSMNDASSSLIPYTSSLMLVASCLPTHIPCLSVLYLLTKMMAMVRVSRIYFQCYMPLLPDSRVRTSILAASYGGPLEGVRFNSLLVRSFYYTRSSTRLVGQSCVFRGCRWLSPFQLISRLYSLCYRRPRLYPSWALYPRRRILLIWFFLLP